MADFFEGRFESYFETLLNRPSLWLFVHVPKTAGSSLNAELQQILWPYHHIFIDYEQLDRRGFFDLLDEAVAEFIARARQKTYLYCTGHIRAAHTALIARALPNVRPMTILRDPVARFVSDYRYQCSSAHPGHEDFRKRHPAIESYLDVEGEWNKAATHLVPPSLQQAGDAEACIDYLMSTHAFVGIQDSYALSLRAITTLAGKAVRPAIFKRVSAEGSAVKMSKRTQTNLRERNRLDIAIYESFAARFDAVAPALIDYLDRAYPLAG